MKPTFRRNCDDNVRCLYNKSVTTIYVVVALATTTFFCLYSECVAGTTTFCCLYSKFVAAIFFVVALVMSIFFVYIICRRYIIVIEIATTFFLGLYRKFVAGFLLPSKLRRQLVVVYIANSSQDFFYCRRHCDDNFSCFI